jgi:DNA-binding response OmpR family regulator
MSSILVIDDDPAVTNVLKLFLESSGYAVVTAQGFIAGKTVLDTSAPDAVILDLNMPDGLGLDLLAHLRVHLQRKTPVLVLSGNRQESTVLRALEMGANDFVRKPFSPREVTARLRKLLT